MTCDTYFSTFIYYITKFFCTRKPAYN